MNRRIGWVLGIGLVAIASAAVFARVTGKHSADRIPVDEMLSLVPDELKFKPDAVADSDNAWMAFGKVGIPPQGKLKAPRNLPAIRQALLLPSASVTTMEADYEPRKILNVLREHVSLLAAEAEKKLSENDSKTALEDLKAALKINDMVGKAAPPLEYTVVSSSLLSRALRSIREVACSANANEQVLSQLLEILPNPKDLDSQYKQSIKSDLYWFVRHELDRLNGPGFEVHPEQGTKEAERDESSGWDQAKHVAETLLEDHRDPFDKRDTVTSAGKIYLEVLHNVDRPWSSQVDMNKPIFELVREWPPTRMLGGEGKSDLEKQDEAKAHPGLMAAKNPYGKFVLWFNLTVSDQSNMAPFRNRADVAASRLALACRLFELRNKKLPSKLEELKSAGLVQELPKDPFSEADFRYDPATRRIWSVGPNRKDDGGAGGGSLTAQALDFVWNIPSVHAYVPHEVPHYVPPTAEAIRNARPPTSPMGLSPTNR